MTNVTKRAAALLIAAVMLLCVIAPVTTLAAQGLSNFTQVKTYATGQFTDVADSAWYRTYVQQAYELNLVNGKTATTFAPDSNLTIAEAVKLAACMHRIYYAGVNDLQNGETLWYQTFVDYALANGIIASGYANYTAAALRSDFAMIFAAALPQEALTPVNTVDDDAVPDVLVNYTYGGSVYLLYRAGILSGSDEAGTFYPNNNIKRSEVAAIVARMADASKRVSVTLKKTQSAQTLTAEQIAEKCSPAVFYIEALNTAGRTYKTGSGFFISDSGIAVTNYHVIEGATTAKITMPDGTKYTVDGVYDYDLDYDLALLKITAPNPFPYLEIGDSDTVKQGETIYTIGSPQGLQNTFASGIVSNKSRSFEDYSISFIQIDAAISAGSSGGALINAQGKVIGVTCASYVSGQNLNLAIPINPVNDLERSQSVLLETLRDPVVFYANFATVPDYGAYYEVPLYDTYIEPGLTVYFYDYDKIATDYETSYLAYAVLLEENGYEFYTSGYDEGELYIVYRNDKYNVSYGLLDLYDVFVMSVQIKAIS